MATIPQNENDPKTTPSPPHAAPASRPQASAQPQPAKPSPGKRPAQNIAYVRAAIGLSAEKPSDMIAGLDKVVERAERQEQRENAKRKAGGKVDVNTALHVDDTGTRWTKKVWIGIGSVSTLVVLLFITLFYVANNKAITPRLANETSRKRLELLRTLAEQMKKWNAPDEAKLENVKSRLFEKLDEELDTIKTQLEASKGNKRPSDESVLREKQDLSDLKSLKDGWGQPIEFSMSDPDTLQISVKPATQGDTPAPVTVIVTNRKKK